MPTKLNKAGNQQPYVPQGNGDASGEYADNQSGSNKHFTNFAKPEETKTKIVEDKPKKDIGVQVKDKGDKPADTSTIKSQYNGKGKQVLADNLSKRLSKGPNTKYLLDAISGADDEISGVIGDFYGANPRVELKLGKNLNSKYQTSITHNYWTGVYSSNYLVSIGQGVFKEEEYYSKGGVFFHESGHALDATYVVNGTVKEEWSYFYVSQKYGKPMCQMVQEEIREHKGEYEELKAKIQAERDALEKSIFGEKENQEYETLKQNSKAMYTAFENDNHYKELINKQNKIAEECSSLRDSVLKEYAKDNYNNRELANAYSQKRDELLNSSKEINNYRNEFFAKNYPEYQKNKQREDELMDLKFSSKSKAKAQICVKYGDLSDMFMAAGVGDLCGMGHTQYGYWTMRHIGNECFAEITSAKATNQASLELMKKYIPKSLEIYDEIMDNIKNKRNVYNKA